MTTHLPYAALPRRGFLIGAASLLVAPAIVRVASLMPIKVPAPVFLVQPTETPFTFTRYVGYDCLNIDAVYVAGDDVVIRQLWYSR